MTGWRRFALYWLPPVLYLFLIFVALLADSALARFLAL